MLHTHQRFAETATSIPLLRANNGFQRFHTASVDPGGFIVVTRTAGIDWKRGAHGGLREPLGDGDATVTFHNRREA
jgi:hypothetical protein